ncbi:MAG: TonB-dependent receptor [Nannocystaceae bacterium]
MGSATAATIDPGEERNPAHEDDAESGQDEGSAEAAYRTVVRGDRRDPQRSADRRNPGFVTAIDVAAQDGTRPADDLPQLLGEQAATRVRSLGGLGQYSAVSIRGSTAQQVSFYIDGVPLGQSLSGLVNPSDLPLDGLDSVEVYRGYLPLAFGAAIGGAIHLVTDHRCRGPVMRALGGAGSFAAHEARVAYKRAVGRFCVDARVGMGGAAGGFTFLDTRGTPQNADDDRFTRRLNNHYERIVAQVGFAGRRGRWRVRGRELVFFKRQGIPGPGHAQARQTELDTLTARSLLSLSQPTLFGPGAPLTWVAGVGVERRHYRDPLSEVGLGVDDERLLAGDLYVSPRVTLPLWTGAKLDLLGEGRGEAIAIADLDGGDDCAAASRRLAVAAGAQLEQRIGERLLLAPAIRADGLLSQARGCGEAREDAEFGPSPRLAGRLALVGGLSLRASVGRYFRAPNLLELFGDRGYVVGNDALVPERGTNAEGGFVIDRRGAAGSLRAHAAGFWTRAEDLIQWVQTGPVIQPMNLAAATLRGLESGVHAEVWRRLLVADASYTLLATTNHSAETASAGKRLPGRPLHQVFARASVGRRFTRRGVAFEPRLSYSVESIAGTFLDAAERVAVPPRTLHGCGVALTLADRLHLTVELRNLLDRRTTTWLPPIRGATPLTVPISDFIGYPLPGRSLWASLRVDLYVLPSARRT